MTLIIYYYRRVAYFRIAYICTDLGNDGFREFGQPLRIYRQTLPKSSGTILLNRTHLSDAHIDSII